jgi:autotransporter-associated beta strand protein
MKTLQNTVSSLIAIIALVTFLAENVQAGDALWKTDPDNGDWNNANNWSLGGPPNSSDDVASFGMTNLASLFLSADTQLKAIKFRSDAPAYSISVPPLRVLTISGLGSLIASSAPQNFFVKGGENGTRAQIHFQNYASAGVNAIYTAEGAAGNTVTSGALIQFEFRSTADHTTIHVNGGRDMGDGALLLFSDNSTADHAMVINHSSGRGGGETRFDGGSTAGNGIFINQGGVTALSGGGATDFGDGATAGNGTFINEGGATNQAVGGTTRFFSAARSGNGTFVNNGGAVAGAHGGSTQFDLLSSADHGTFTLNGATIAGAGGGEMYFRRNSTAGNGTFLVNGPGVNQGGRGFIQFLDNSTAGSGIFTLNGGPAGGLGPGIDFALGTTAGSATFIVNGGFGSFGRINVAGSAGNATFVANGNAGEFGGDISLQSNSTGGTARIALNGTGRLETFEHNTSELTIGSLEGNGPVIIGNHKLSIGSVNVSTIFSGVVQEQMIGSLGKIGTGTLVLGGASTYTGATTVNGGKLAVNGSIVSAVTVSRGTISGTGLINAAVAVNTGAALLGGDAVTPTGSLKIGNNLTLNNASIIELVLGPSGMHSSLTRTGGTWNFAPNQRFTFLDVGAQPGFYDNIITGLTSDPGGTNTWTITNLGFIGTFAYDGAGNIDLTLTSADGPALQLIGAASRKTHGAAGNFDIPLPLTGEPGVECRASDGNHTLIFAFNNNVVSGNASLVNGTATVTNNQTFASNTMTVALTGVADIQTVTVMLSDVHDSFGQVLPDKTISVNMLIGDTNGSKIVNATDAGQIKGQVGMPVTSSNYRNDLNADGAVSSSDVTLVKKNSGHGLAMARLIVH